MAKVEFNMANGHNPETELADFLMGPFPTKESLLKAGQAQVARIKKRTAEGRDVNGLPFAPYAPPYAKRRSKKGLRTSPPDLRVNGNMLDSMLCEVQGNREMRLVIEDPQAAEYAQYLNEGTGKMPPRRFWDCSEEELDQMLIEMTTDGPNAAE